MFSRFLPVISLCTLLIATGASGQTKADKEDQVIELRAWTVPSTLDASVPRLALLEVIKRFQEENPGIRPVPALGLMIPGGAALRTMDMIPAFLLLKRFPLWSLLGGGAAFFLSIWLLMVQERVDEVLELHHGPVQTDSGRDCPSGVYRCLYQFHVRLDHHSRPEDVDLDGLAVPVPVSGPPGGALRFACRRGNSNLGRIPVLPEHNHPRHRRADGKIAADYALWMLLEIECN